MFRPLTTIIWSPKRKGNYIHPLKTNGWKGKNLKIPRLVPRRNIDTKPAFWVQNASWLWGETTNLGGHVKIRLWQLTTQKLPSSTLDSHPTSVVNIDMFARYIYIYTWNRFHLGSRYILKQKPYYTWTISFCIHNRVTCVHTKGQWVFRNLLLQKSNFGKGWFTQGVPCTLWSSLSEP